MKSDIAFWIYFLQGRIENSYDTSHEALKIADESGDVFSKAHAYLAHGVSYFGKGYLKEAEEHLLKAVDFAERTNQLPVTALSNF
ncbi:hypothetical protein C6A37_12790, partial [Desulfobacteraceae bacterium SEEP-SAG9]